jgi:hypothetical protein
MIQIRYAHNGWIVQHQEEGEPDKFYVFSHTGNEESEIRAFRDLLVTIQDIYGPVTSRYSEHRIYTVVRPGDKSDKFTDKDAELLYRPDEETPC